MYSIYGALKFTLCCNYRVESALQMNENAHYISVRWTASSQEYVDTKAVSLHRGKQELKKRINKDARERWILLRLKSKYAGKVYLFTMNTLKITKTRRELCVVICNSLFFFGMQCCACDH